MDKETITELARAIVNETILSDWYFYVILLAIAFLGSYAAAYATGYAKVKAKHKAIQSNLEEIKNQLRETTKTTEQIKNDIEHEVWRKKEIESIKREKLEEYLGLVYVGKDALHQKMMNTFFHEDTAYDEHALGKADIIQRLYFPELALPHADFLSAQSKYMFWIAEDGGQVGEQMKKGIQKPTPSQEHQGLQVGILAVMNESLIKLDQASKDYAISLNC